jgi:hypothetical protein
MPTIQIQVSIEVDTIDGQMPRDRVLEYVRVGVHNAIVRESQCINLLPPSIMSKREKIKTTLLSVIE